MGYRLPAFSLSDNASDQRQNVRLLLAAVQQAAREYGSEAYLRRQQACMALNVSWEQPAAEWEAVLQQVLLQHAQRPRQQQHAPPPQPTPSEE